MSNHLLAAALCLAYGPFVLMALLYLIGLALRATGRSGLLHMLVGRTEMPKPISRPEADPTP